MSSEVPIPEAPAMLDNIKKEVDEKENLDARNKSNAEGDRDVKKENGKRALNTSNRQQRSQPPEPVVKPMIQQGVKGKVKWYSVRYHYGFIARDDDREHDVFVHQTAIAKSRINKVYLRTLDDDEDVVFDIVQGKQGLEAANVTGPDGAEVRGSRFHNLQFYSFRRRVGLDRDGRRFTRRNLRTDDSRKVISGEGEKNRRIRSAPRQRGLRSGGEERVMEGDQPKGPNNEQSRNVRSFRPRRNRKQKDGEQGGGDVKKAEGHDESEEKRLDEARGDARQGKGYRKRDRGYRRRTGTNEELQQEKDHSEGEKKEGNEIGAEETHETVTVNTAKEINAVNEESAAETKA